MTNETKAAGGGTPISPKSAILRACVRAAWQDGSRNRSELTDDECHGHADAYATNALRVWGLANVQEADLTGPTAWRHKLPEGKTFLGGQTSQVVESLQEALGHKDRFGGELQPLFELGECYTNGGRDPGGETGQRQRETRMDASSAPGGDLDQRQPQADPHDHSVALARNAAFNEARGLLPALAREHFQRTDVTEEFLNGLAYGACAYVAVIKKLQEGALPSLAQAMDSGQRQSEAFDLLTGRPVIQDIGAAIDAASAEAAAAGEPDANRPANEAEGP